MIVKHCDVCNRPENAPFWTKTDRYVESFITPGCQLAHVCPVCFQELAQALEATVVKLQTRFRSRVD